MKQVFFLLVLTLVVPFSAKSQLVDDFQDGDLTGNPAWGGQVGEFGVRDGRLQLQASALDNEAFIFLPAATSIDQPTVWAFKVQLDFAPSASNFATVYLAASNPDLRAVQEGYYLKIGGISGDQDALELYRQDEDDHVLLLSGTAGAVSGDPVTVAVQIRRSTTGEWELLADYSGGTAYRSEGLVQDATYPSGAYAGIVCRYTSTRREAFFFDDFGIDPVLSDTAPAELVGVEIVSETEIVLNLNEPVRSEGASLNENYSISGGIGQPLGVELEGSPATRIRLLLGRALTDQTTYTLTVSNLEDLAGNVTTAGITFDYFILQTPAPGDLLINELLFNPQTGGSDFLELYNPSDKVLDLDGLRLLNTRVESSNREKTISRPPPLFPGEYLVITPDPEDIEGRYTVTDPRRLLDNALPTLEDKAGNITLLVEDTPIDSFNYSEDFHFNLLARRDGVSLERISFKAPTNDPGNWYSAASTAGFATPGYENSQFLERPDLLGEMIRIPNPRLSPDGDGFEDVLLIQYETTQPGYVLNLRIFDARGRLVSHLVRNELLANAGTFKWDGFTNEFTKARIGIYILWFELFDASGKVEERKETVVVAGKL